MTAVQLPMTLAAINQPRPSAKRVYDGIRVDGQHFRILLSTGADSRIGVRVLSNPEASGYVSESMVGSESVAEQRFTLEEIQVSEARLECFSRARHQPLYSEGFRLELELGMASVLRAWLPKLAKASSLAEAIASAFIDRLKKHPLVQFYSFTSTLAARIVLDGQSSGEALAEECASFWTVASPGPQIGETMQLASVRKLLRTVVSEYE